MEASSESDFSRKGVLFWVAIYFSVCGLSAIFWPSSWYALAGLTERSISSDLILGVVGAMMVGLAVGAFAARSSSKADTVVILAIVVASLIDLAVVAICGATGGLPLFNTIAFCLVDALWVVILLRVLDLVETLRILGLK